MSLPSWLGGGGTPQLVIDAVELAPLRDLLDVLAPDASGPLPVVIHGTTGSPGAAQTHHGSGSLWGATEVQFAIRVDGGGAPVAMSAHKPMLLADDLHLPGIDHDTLWMIIQADTETDDGVLAVPDGRSITLLHRYVFGVVDIGGVSRCLRIQFQDDDLIAEVDFTADLTDIERMILDGETAQSGQVLDRADPIDLGHVAALLGTDQDPNADLRWLPEPLRRPDLLTIDGFGFTVSPDGADHILDASIRFGIAESGRWTLIPGFPYLTVGQVTASLGVRHPLDAKRRRPHLDLRGVIGLGDAALAVEARWPDLAIRGELLDGADHPITLSQLLSIVHLPPIEHGPAIERLAIEARPTGATRTLSIRAAARDVLRIPIGGSSIDLDQLAMTLELARGEERSLDADLSAVIEIGGVELLAEAATVHDADGWQLTARLGSDPIDVGALETWIGERFGAHTLPDNLVADSVDITGFNFGYQTATGDASFHIVTTFALTSSSTAQTGELELDFDLAHHGGDHYERSVAGLFSLGDHRFSLVDAIDGGAGGPPGPEMLVGTYQHTGTSVTVGDLLEAAGVPFPIAVDLTDAVIGHSSGATLCFVDMVSGFDLAELPLVGPLLTGDTELGFALRVLVTSGRWDEDLVARLNHHLAAGIAAVPAPEKGQTLAPAGLVATVTIAGQPVHVPELGVDLKESAKTSGAAPTSSGPTDGSTAGSIPVEPAASGVSGASWVPIQRSLGPVHARRIGVDFDAAHSTIELLLDADLSLGGFTLSLEGLGVTSPIDHIAPTFSLTGLGLDVSTDAYEIGGSFLRTGPTSFAGAATVRTPTFTLSAIGAYGETAGHPTVFLYAVLDYPLGGPSFFFVTGLAAGFGYNRRLVMPAPDGIAEFPLVHDAVAGTANAELPSADGLAAKLAALESYLPASYGDLFFAIGVKFNSFKLIDSFVLAAVSIRSGGSDVRIDVLGLSTMVLPSPEAGRAADPLAEVQIALHAQILPNEGFVGVDARLTSASYVLSRDCHLRGGAAFYAWFGGDHAGDFVATLGGYHPHFRPPSHYPVVPRLSFDWHITRQLSVKGAMYCALTPNALMAGLSLEANYVDGAIEAWFRTGADFLLSWQPYSYRASMYIAIGARWHFIHGEFGTSLSIWGPDFSGTAEIDIGPLTFTVSFGAGRPHQTTVSWSTLRATSLPKSAEICGVTCQSGLVRQLEPESGLGAEWVVSAHDLVLEASSQIPASRLTMNEGTTTPGVTAEEIDITAGHPDLGVGPVGVNRGGLHSTLNIRVRKVEGGVPAGSVALRTLPVTKAVPAALWGDHQPEPNPNGTRTIDAALVGYRLRPERRDRPAISGPWPEDDLGWNEHEVQRSLPTWITENLAVEEDLPVVPAEESARARAGLLTGLGIDPGEIRPGGDAPDARLRPPRLARFTVPETSS